MVYIKNETPTSGTACYFLIMSKYTDASKRFKHMTSDVKDCKGRNTLECATREGNKSSKSWGVHTQRGDKEALSKKHGVRKT